MRLLVAGLIFAGTMVSAQGMRDGDALFSDGELAEALLGASHTFFDGGRSSFSTTDLYSYTYPDGGVAYGRYEVRDGSVVCTFFNHGFERCDTYVKNGERLVLINEEGVRFPVKTVEAGRAL